METVEKATLGGGCFWCIEAVYNQINGVNEVVPGYAGGDTPEPTYREVCQGNTGHAEVVQITYDPNAIAYEDLLRIFWQIHNPTTKNREGPDVGEQYRSIILYHNSDQEEIALASKKAAEDAGPWCGPIVTEISPLDTFWEAEEKHHNYYQNNSEKQYCKAVIEPKLQKFEQLFSKYLEEVHAE